MNESVLIVGAGPAGLSCAIELLENAPGTPVTILEALTRSNRYDAKYPGAGHSMCSGGLGKGMLDLIGWPIPDSIKMAPIRRAILRSPNETVEISNEDVGIAGDVGVVLDRKKLDDWLLKRAVDLGAEYYPGLRITTVGGGQFLGWRASNKEKALHADWLIGADGPESLVARHAFNAPPLAPRDTFVASEVYVPAKSFPKDAIEIYFQPERLQGYYWTFSAGDVVKIGCGTTKESGKNPSYETAWWRGKKRDETGDSGYLADPVERVGGRITGSRPLPRVVDPKRRCAIVGEAARAVWASIGAGDASAIETGRCLGRSLANGRPQDYQRHWDTNVRPFLTRHWRIKEALLSLNDHQMDRAIRAVRNFHPRSTNTRAEVPRLFRHVLLHDPMLLGIATLKAMIPW